MPNQTVTLYRKAYAGLSRPTWLLSLVMLVNRSGTMVIPFMTIYLTQQLHYSIAQAGYVMALFGGGAIAGAFLGGRLTDKLGFYPVQFMALFGGGIMFVVLGQMHAYSLICLFTFVLSLINEAFRPANATAIAHYSNIENRTRSYSLNRLAINLGWAAGGALGGFIASRNYTLLFWVDGCTNICAAILLLLLLPPVTKPTDHHDHRHQEAHTSSSAFRDKGYLFFLLLTTLFALCFFQIFTTLPVFLKQELRLSMIFIGNVMALNGLLITVIEMVLVYTLEGRKQNTWYISLGVLFLGLSYIVLNLPLFSAAFTALACIVIITFGEMFTMPFMNAFWVSRTNSSNRGQYASLYTIAYSVAQVLGPTIGANIVQAYGFNMLWWVMGSVCLVNAILFRTIK